MKYYQILFTRRSTYTPQARYEIQHAEVEATNKTEAKRIIQDCEVIDVETGKTEATEKKTS